MDLKNCIFAFEVRMPMYENVGNNEAVRLVAQGEGLWLGQWSAIRFVPVMWAVWENSIASNDFSWEKDSRNCHLACH